MLHELAIYQPITCKPVLEEFSPCAFDFFTTIWDIKWATKGIAVLDK